MVVGMTRTPGIRWTGHGWQVFVRVRGQFRSKHFPADTPMGVLKAKRAELHALGVLGQAAPTATTGPTLGDDAELYLKAVAGMPTISDRAYRIRLWVSVLGADTPRASVTPAQIRTALQQWKADGKSIGTLNLRLTALRHLWRVLDGRTAPNPARDIPREREPATPLVLPPWKTAVKVVHSVDGLSGIRLRILLYTGWPSAILKKVRPEDIDAKRREVRLHGRQKGTGTRERTLPILPKAKTALMELVKADGMGAFSNSSIHTSLQRACTRAKVRPFSVYTLRHLFLTEMTLRTKDERAVSELAMHSTPQQTRRYTEHAVSTRTRKALATFATR